MLANSAHCSDEMETWGMDSTDEHYNGRITLKEND